MDRNTDDAWLLALGVAVSDGAGVDWDTAEQHAVNPDQRRLIGELRLLSTVVDAHRQLPLAAALDGPDSQLKRREVWDVFVRTVDARDDEQVLMSFPGDKFVEDWSPDGRFLTGTLRQSGLWLMPVASAEPPVPIRGNPSAQHWQSGFSPDGRWLAYTSSESGKPEVYVEPFPATGARWQVSTSGGSEPRWRGDGTELLYLDAEDMLMSVRVNGATWKPSPPQRLFPVLVPETSDGNYAISPDGRFVVLNTFVSDPAVPPIEVVVNWQSLARW